MKDHNWQDISATWDIGKVAEIKTWYCARCGGLAFTSRNDIPGNHILLKGVRRELTCSEAIVTAVLES